VISLGRSLITTGFRDDEAAAIEDRLRELIKP